MKEVEELLIIMRNLRDPATGCPWDRQQDFASLANYALEEAYEVVDAIEQKDMKALCSELGDLLFQVVFHAQLAEELGEFNFRDVVKSISKKLTERHPHVFGDAKVDSAEHQTKMWEMHKRNEQRKGDSDEMQRSVLNGIAGTLPAITRSVKLQKRAASVGFDWKSISPIFDKVVEELEEVRVEVNDANLDGMEDEIGDLLFAVTNLARHAKVDPETALRRANRKFEMRFKKLENRVTSQGLNLETQSQDQLEALWIEVKKQGLD